MERPWLRHYDYFVPESIRYPRVPLYKLLELTCVKYDRNVATIFFGQKLTYGELREKVRRLASALRSMGVNAGDRVALMLPNCPQFIISYYGILEAGAVVTNVSPLHVEREIEYELNDSGAETIIYLDIFHSRIEAVKESTPLKRRIISSITDFMAEPVKPAAERGPADFYFLELLEIGEPDPPEADLDPDNDLAALQYTGGDYRPSQGGDAHPPQLAG